MPLARMGSSGFDLDKVVAVVRHPPLWFGAAEAHVTVYLCDAVSVDLRGEDATAFLAFVATLPAAEERLGPVGSRVATVNRGRPEGDEPVRRKNGN